MKTSGYMAAIAVVTLAVAQAWALPAGRDVFFGSHAEGTERTFYRDGVTVMPNANRLQPVRAINEINDGVWTNAANNYLYGNDILFTQAVAATTLGSDPLGGGYTNYSGEWNTRVAGGDTELGGNMYYVRLFSAPSVTGAAYYTDTTNIYGTYPTTEYYTFTDMLVNVVSPAYDIPIVAGPGAATVYMVTGIVYAAAAGGNNQLESGWLLIEWRYPGDTEWHTGTENVGADGEYAFIPAVTNAGSIVVRARVKDAYTPRAGFPFSADSTVGSVMPIPAPQIVITTTVTAVEYAQASIDIAGTSVYCEGGLTWSNAATGATGSVPAAEGWSVAEIELLEGANEITVTGTNIAHSGSAVITVTRADRSTVAALADITNGAFRVAFAQSTCTIGGTNNMFSVGEMTWSNVTLGVGGKLPVMPGWEITGVPLGPRTNVIEVYVTNIYGHVAVDSVEVIRGLANEVALIAPPNGWLTNVHTLALEVYYGEGIQENHRYVSTNNGENFIAYAPQYTLPGDAVYYWCAQGYDTGWAQRDSTTNELRIVTQPPQVELISPKAGAVYTNTYALDLLASYGMADMGRQLSTNSGANWFDYIPGEKVIFGSTGTWHWTARGLNVAGWGYAPETNDVTIISEISGAYDIRPVYPADGDILTNPAPAFNAVAIGNFQYTGIITNPLSNTQKEIVAYPTNIYVGYGVHTWTAYGVYINPPPVYVYAEETNTFEVLDPAQPAVRLLASADGTVLEEGAVAFDVLYLNVSQQEMSTNNGTAWFTYQSPINMKPGQYHWTARGYGGSGWVYAPGTNSLTILPLTKLVITTESATVTYDVDEYTIAGTASEAIVGGLTWTNTLTGARGTGVASTSWQLSNLPLGVGTNVISVSGTNVLMYVSQSQVQIIRGIPGTGLPELYITTLEPAETTNATLYTIEGTINTNVVLITYTNWLNGAAGETAAVEHWKIEGIPLAVGQNEIHVKGSNLTGEYSEDVFRVMVPEPGAAVMLALGMAGMLARRRAAKDE